MQILVNISEGHYKTLQRMKEIGLGYYHEAILNGKIIPKGHGDLKDNDILDTIFLNATNSPNKKLSYEEISNLILDAPTVIEADNETDDYYRGAQEEY